MHGIAQGVDREATSLAWRHPASGVIRSAVAGAVWTQDRRHCVRMVPSPECPHRDRKVSEDLVHRACGSAQLVCMAREAAPTHPSTTASTMTALTAWRLSEFRAPPGSPDALYFWRGGGRPNSSSSNSRWYPRRGSPPAARERHAPIIPLTPGGHRPLFRGMPRPVFWSVTGGGGIYSRSRRHSTGAATAQGAGDLPRGEASPAQCTPPGQLRQTNRGSAHPGHVPQRSNPARQSLAPDLRTTEWWGQGCARPCRA